MIFAIVVAWHCLITSDKSVYVAYVDRADVSFGASYWTSKGFSYTGYASNGFVPTGQSSPFLSYAIYSAGGADLPQSQIDDINSVREMSEISADLIDFGNPNFQSGLVPYKPFSAVVLDKNGFPRGFVGYNEFGDLVLVSGSLGSDGNFIGEGYNSQGKLGVFSVPFVSSSPDVKPMAVFTPSVPPSPVMPDANVVDSDSLSFLGYDSSDGQLSNKPVSDRVILDQSSSNLDGEMVKGLQAVLDSLYVGEIPVVDYDGEYLPEIDQADLVSDDVADTMQGTIFDSSVDPSSVLGANDVSSIRSFIEGVYGRFPTIGQRDFSFVQHLTLGNWQYDIDIDFSRYQISLIRDCFAFVILFLASVFAVRVVGGAFE